MKYGRERRIKYHRGPGGRESLLTPWGQLIRPLVLKAASRKDGRIEVRPGRSHERHLANVLGSVATDGRDIVRGYRDLRDTGLVVEEPGAIRVAEWSDHLPRRGSDPNDPNFVWLYPREGHREGQFGRLPAAVRGLGHNLLRIADDDGMIPETEEGVLRALRWWSSEHRGIRRSGLVARWLEVLLADGYIERTAGGLHITRWADAQPQQLIPELPMPAARPAHPSESQRDRAPDFSPVPAIEFVDLSEQWPPEGWPEPVRMEIDDGDRAAEGFHFAVKPSESLEVDMREAGRSGAGANRSKRFEGGSTLVHDWFGHFPKLSKSHGTPPADLIREDQRSDPPLTPPRTGGNAGGFSLESPRPEPRRPRSPRPPRKKLPTRPPAEYPAAFERCWEQALRRDGSRGGKFAAYRAWCEVIPELGDEEALAAKVLEALGWQSQLKQYRRADAKPPDFATYLRGSRSISWRDRREDQDPAAFGEPDARPSEPEWAREKREAAAALDAKRERERRSTIAKAKALAEQDREFEAIKASLPSAPPPLPPGSFSIGEGLGPTATENAPEKRAKAAVPNSADPAVRADGTDSTPLHHLVPATLPERAPPIAAPGRPSVPVGDRRE